jgi:hypothetical protein
MYVRGRNIASFHAGKSEGIVPPLLFPLLLPLLPWLLQILGIVIVLRPSMELLSLAECKVSVVQLGRKMKFQYQEKIAQLKISFAPFLISRSG